MKKNSFNYKKIMGVIGGVLLAIQSILLAFDVSIDNDLIATILNTITGFLVAMGIIPKSEAREYLENTSNENEHLDDAENSGSNK